jgi:chemotaxis protein methyltransferase CheR
MKDSNFLELLTRLGLSWAGYRQVRKGVKRRISRHMQRLSLRTIGEYLLELEENPEVREETWRLLAVPISRFFRDVALWQSLERSVLPAVLARGGGRRRVWSAGCARGEEAYSFAIVWRSVATHWAQAPELELWATDINPALLAEAQSGVYPASSLREVAEPWRAACFERLGESSFAVVATLKTGIRWRVHDLLSENPPGSDFQVIFLRNSLLTYYNETLQKAALERIAQSLAPGGVLVVGSHEKLPYESLGLRLYRHQRCIFQKVQVAEPFDEHQEPVTDGSPRLREIDPDRKADRTY